MKFGKRIKKRKGILFSVYVMRNSTFLKAILKASRVDGWPKKIAYSALLQQLDVSISPGSEKLHLLISVCHNAVKPTTTVAGWKIATAKSLAFLRNSAVVHKDPSTFILLLDDRPISHWQRSLGYWLAELVWHCGMFSCWGNKIVYRPELVREGKVVICLVLNPHTRAVGLGIGPL